MTPILRTLLLGLAVLPACAQGSGFGIHGSLLAGLDSLRKATHGRGGITLGLDHQTRLPHADMGVRTGLTLGWMPGRTKAGLTTDLRLVQAFGDLRIPVGGSLVTAIAGLSVNHYGLTKTGTESDEPSDVERHFPVRDARGLKLGVRLGVSLRLSDRWSGELLLQQTELAGKDLEDPLVRPGGINPAWIQFGVRCAF